LHRRHLRILFIHLKTKLVHRLGVMQAGSNFAAAVAIERCRDQFSEKIADRGGENASRLWMSRLCLNVLRQGRLIFANLGGGLPWFYSGKICLRSFAQLDVVIHFLAEILNRERVLVHGNRIRRLIRQWLGLCRDRGTCSQNPCDRNAAFTNTHRFHPRGA